MALILSCCIGMTACGGGDGDPEPRAGTTGAPAETSTGPGTPTSADGLPAVPGAERGREVAMQSGCLACHEIGQAGNNGPGPELTDVGNRLAAAQIRQTILEGRPPMPSFSDLPRADLAELVEYLSALEG